MRTVTRRIKANWLAALLFAAGQLLAGNCLASPQFDYLLHCAGCHLENGAGMPPDIPDLRQDLGYLASIPAGRAYLVQVPGVAESPISDAAVAEVLNWMLDRIVDNKPKNANYFSAAEVAEHRQEQLLDPLKLRAQLLAQRPTAQQTQWQSSGPEHAYLHSAHQENTGFQSGYFQQTSSQTVALRAMDLQTAAAPKFRLQKPGSSNLGLIKLGPSSQQKTAPKKLAPEKSSGKSISKPPAPSNQTSPKPASDEQHPAKGELEQLGQALFFDTALSRRGNLSCASCHDPARAFSDPRHNGVAAAASRGDDGKALGDRNAPTLSYVGLVPVRYQDEVGETVGGHFWDGRAASLEEQALGPLLNPLEMGLQNEAELAERLNGNAFYQQRFRALYDPGITSDPKRLAAAAAEALASFQRSQSFASFDSKYDRYLRGEYEPTRQERIGMDLFFSQDFTNCSVCHQAQPLPAMPRESFSNQRYENIGVPTNTQLRRANGLASDYVDLGLATLTGKSSDAGRFRVPTLRNVAVTAPYMHNGAFTDLRSVMQFYNKYNSSGRARQFNPDTLQAWGEAELPHNIALERLKAPMPLDDRQMDAVIAFLHMLTDARYER